MKSAAGALPLVGHLPQLLRRPLEFVSSLRNLDSVVKIKVGPRVGYVVTTPDATHAVLVTHLSDFSKGGPVFDNTRDVLGESVATSNGEAHRRNHNMMLPAFHHERVAGYAKVLTRLANDHVGSWSPGATLQMSQEMHSLTAAMLARTVFTTDLDAPGVLSKGIWEFAAEIGRRTYIPIKWVHRLPLWVNRRFRQADDALDNLVQAAIAEYRSAPGDRGDLLSMLLAAVDDEGQPMTDAELRNEVRLITLAGTTAVSVVLGVLFDVLGKRPDVEAKVRAELDDVLDGSDVTAAALPALGYTKRVIAEVLRMYPPAWLATRRSLRETTIDGHVIPAGVDVYFSPYALQHDPASFPQPEKFDPDRWLPERSAEYPRRAYIPFGTGFRKCFAENYADVVMLATVAAVVSRWRLQPVGEAAVTVDLLYRLKNSVMRVERR
jgi:pentalenene oxygenase